MAEVTHILCPIDFSDHSRHALEHAVAFATWYSARITAMHVPVGFAAAAPGIDAPVADAAVPAMLPTRPEDLLDELRAFVEPARRARVRVDVRIDDGSAADEILRLEQELAIDLIVLGTHGRSGFEQLVLGSVAQKVLRKASCPVLTIPPPAEDLTASVPVLLERILCPLDFSAASLRALEHALSLAREASANLTLFHAVEWLAEEAITQYAGREVRRRIEREALERIRAAVPDDVRTWCTVDELVTSGRASREIVRLARERDASVIVMGAHGRHSLHRMFFGATTHHVVREASCPVLTLRAD
jgi:nucleotide-binding universal stress UspA family protein